MNSGLVGVGVAERSVGLRRRACERGGGGVGGRDGKHRRVRGLEGSIGGRVGGIRAQRVGVGGTRQSQTQLATRRLEFAREPAVHKAVESTLKGRTQRLNTSRRKEKKGERKNKKLRRNDRCEGQNVPE